MSPNVATVTLSRAFYARDSVTVAQALLGQRLVRAINGVRLAGRISETEAYGGPDDQASHAYRRTPRSSVMYGPPGYAYVYFIYGVHHCLNAVTGQDGVPGAVLIRALIPDEGLDLMRQRRGLPGRPGAHGTRGVADGPGKLCEALGITIAESGLDLTGDDQLFIEQDERVAEDQIKATPRIGVAGDAETRARPWRFVWSPPPRSQPAEHGHFGRTEQESSPKEYQRSPQQSSDPDEVL